MDSDQGNPRMSGKGRKPSGKVENDRGRAGRTVEGRFIVI